MHTYACLWLHICLSIFACVSVCITHSFFIKTKCGSSHKFTHSPCFDSIQSTVCIITLVPCGNLLGPKYCSLTNPSFVFRGYTKHQSCFSACCPKKPSFFYARVHTCTQAYTHHPTTHALPHSTETESSTDPKAGWLEQQDMLGTGFVINIFLFQMVPPTTLKDTTTGPGDREGIFIGGKDKNEEKHQD